MKKIYVTILVLLIILSLGLENISLAVPNAPKNMTAEEAEIRSNKYLKSLTLADYEMSPEFNKNTLNYYVFIPNELKELNVDATAEEEANGAIVRITGNNLLNKQENIINVRVTAQDGTSRLYTITAIKQPEVNLKLNTLEIEGIDINPIFSQDTFFYTASIEDTELRSLNVTALPNDTEATVEIIGASELIDGKNLISIILTKGKEKTIYQIDMDIDFLGEKEKEISNVITEVRQIINYVVIGLIAFVVFIILIIIITIIVKKRKNKKSKVNKGGRRHD